MTSKQLLRRLLVAERFCFGICIVLAVLMVVALVIDIGSSVILWVAVAILWHSGFGIFFRTERGKELDKSKPPSLK